MYTAVLIHLIDFTPMTLSGIVKTVTPPVHVALSTILHISLKPSARLLELIMCLDNYAQYDKIAEELVELHVTQLLNNCSLYGRELAVDIVLSIYLV